MLTWQPGRACISQESAVGAKDTVADTAAAAAAKAGEGAQYAKARALLRDGDT